MASALPFVANDPEQIITITLDAVPYVLRARWNTYDSAWYLDAWEGDGTTPIAFGLKLVLGVYLAQRTGHPLFAAGMFLAPSDDSGIDPGIADLGGRVNVIHMTAQDAVSALALPT